MFRVPGGENDKQKKRKSNLSRNEAESQHTSRNESQQGSYFLKYLIHSTIHHPHPIHHTSPQDRNVGTQNVADLCKQVSPEKTKKKKKHKKAKRRQLEKATPSGTHVQNVPKERPKINNKNTQRESVSPPK